MPCVCFIDVSETNHTRSYATTRRYHYYTQLSHISPSPKHTDPVLCENRLIRVAENAPVRQHGRCSVCGHHIDSHNTIVRSACAQRPLSLPFSYLNSSEVCDKKQEMPCHQYHRQQNPIFCIVVISKSTRDGLGTPASCGRRLLESRQLPHLF